MGIFRLIGQWQMRALDPTTGRIVFETQGENLITNSGLSLVAGLLSGDETEGLLVLALGTDGTAPTPTDIALGAEQSRRALTIRSRSGNKAEFSVYFPASECSFYIREAGVFGGIGADPGTAGSGTLFSRYSVDYDNSTGTVDITFDYTVTVERV